MVISDYKYEGNKLSLTLDSKEDLIATYYIDSYKELLYLKDNIQYGKKVKVKGTLKVPNNNTVFKTFNYKRYLNNKDIYYILDISNIEILSTDISFIYKLKNIINKRISNIDNNGYMKAFILGDKSEIDSEVYRRYQSIGITHLFALSGMHIGLLSSIILKLLKRLNDKSKYLVLDICLVIYGTLVGWPSSIKRCILFFIFNSINKLFKLETSSIKVLFLVVIILIFSNYKIIYDIGFIYSLFTVGGILLFSEFISCNNKVRSSFRLSLIAFIFSLPISLYNFYEINLLSIIYNMFFVPLVSIIIYPLSLISFIIPSIYFVFNYFICILEGVSKILASIKLFNICLDFNLGEIVIYYLVVIFVYFKNDYKFLLCLVLIIVLDIVIPYFDRNAYIYYFDVGQGDCSLLISPYRKDVILIDTGGVSSYIDEEWKVNDPYYVSSNVISFMKSKGIRSIDSLVISHGDYDHMGDAIYLVNNYKIDKVIFNCGAFNELELDLVNELNKKKINYYSCVSNIDSFKFLNTKIYDNENDNSSVVYYSVYGYNLLFMGDAGVEVEEDLVEKYNLQDIDVLKVGHHGSDTSSSKEFIDNINPKYSIISVGKNNRYGHPKDSVLENLEDSKIYRTDQDGSIMFKIKKNKLQIETCSP